MRLILICPDGEIQVGNLQRTKNPLNMDFARLIKCEVCEIFRVKNEKFAGFQFWCDEEGLLKKNPILNPIASYYYGIAEHQQPIVGNVVIAKSIITEEGEDTAELSEEDCIMILEDIKQNKDNIIKACNLEMEGN